MLCQWNLYKLMKEYNVNHVTSSPHYPQSNGLAEKYVQIVRNLFHKAKEEGQDLHKCLMMYRNTPLSSTLQSPMQKLSNRTTRSDLPLSTAARLQMGFHINHPTNKQMKKNHHLPTHDLCIIQPIMYQDATTKKWYPATIVSWCEEPRSYIISTDEGIQYRRTQRHLKPYYPRPQTVVSLDPNNHNNYMQLRAKDNLKPPKKYWVNIMTWAKEIKSQKTNR